MKILRAFTVLLVILFLSLIHLSIYTNSIKVGYEIDGLKKKWDSLRNDTRYLNYLVAKDEALPKIDSIAKSKLNMIYPEKMNYIVINSWATEESH